MVVLAGLLAACAESGGRSVAPSPPALATATVVTSSGPSESVPSPSDESTPSPSAEPVATLIAAGDIAGCDYEGDALTAALVRGLDGTVAVLGDAVYPAGSDATFADCYEPTWGAFRDRTRPTPGNHDLQSDGGAAYWRYFGDAAGTPGEGWYAYELGAWQVVVLNSNCGLVGCGPGSAQHAWLVEELAASDATCTLSYWHHPLFSSGFHGGIAEVRPLWEALEADGAELVLGGHDHHYERFAPQTAGGVASADGVRQFIVGTGGYALYAARAAAPTSEVLMDDVHGVLMLTLRADGYDWSFVDTDGVERDAGSATCH
jgi:alkaline phosphatase